MSTTHKKNDTDDDDADKAAGGAAKHKKGKGRSVAITCNLPDQVDDQAAEEIRGQLQVAVSTILQKRLGKAPVDLIVH